MAIIYTYPVKTNPVGDDLILISDSADSNKTKQAKASTLPNSGGGSVTSVGLSLSNLAAFAVTGDNPVTGSGTITLGTTGGSAGQFLDYQGNWSTPTGTVSSVALTMPSAFSVTGSPITSNGTLAVTLNGGSAGTFLRYDGDWAIPEGTVYSAGDGLNLSSTTFSTDLKLNGGLVIETAKLAVDLSASAITGTLAVGDGGTGATSLAGVLKGNGTGAVTGSAALNDLLDAQKVSTTSLYVGTVPPNAGGATNNTTLGLSCGSSINSGSGNVVIGKDSGSALTTSGNNVMVGYGAGKLVTTGTGANTFIGALAGDNITIGISNVSIGYSAQPSLEEDNYSVAIGSPATAGTSGIAVGRSANAGASGISIGTSSTAGAGGIAIGTSCTAPANEIALSNIASSIVASGTGTSVANQLKITINGSVYYIDLKTP